MPTQAQAFAARLGLSYTPSSYQAAIFDHIENGRGHAVVEAVAGSGKTTTIVSAARLTAGEGLFVAFNKSIASELGTRLEGTSMVAKTVHSVGFAAVRKFNRGVKVNASKYRDLLKTFERDVSRGSICGRKVSGAESQALEEHGRFPMPVIARLLDLVRLSLVDCEASDAFDSSVLALADHHGLDIPAGLESIVVESVRRAALVGKNKTNEVDFTDMIWLPVVHGYATTTYSWVFVDECQDISAAALALVKMCVRRGGRMLFVGDRRQAIYGFAGADAESFANIIESTHATVFPLSVCYRCPSAVLAMAREYCPQVEARPNAPAGVRFDPFVPE